MNAEAALDHIRAIYETARGVSHETRAEVAGGADADPAERWGTILRGRAERGVAGAVRAAGGRVVREAGAGPLAPAVRRAVKNLERAVADLAGFVPEHEPVTLPGPIAERLGRGRVVGYRPTAAALARLDDLRQRVFVRLVVVDELFRDHPDPLARVVAVARRVAVKLLPTAEGERVAHWFERMEQAG